VRRAVFLDRDGVINEALVRDGRALAPLSPQEFQLVPGAAAQVARLRAAGLLAVVVTNQPEIARGALAAADLDRMHARLRSEVELDGIEVCPHDPREGCACCKPAPGMLHRSAAALDIDLGASFLVGDRWRDIGAGRAAGCFSILLERDYSACQNADARVQELSAAVDLILYRLEEAGPR
jgi:D-glycero-D-manno-heptose 1,7-bisphosphate phosphatase